MTLTTVLVSLLGLSVYLLAGMVLVHHTPLGLKFYPTSPVRFIFFWIVLIVGIVFWFMGKLIILAADEFLMDKSYDNPGLSSIVDPN